MAWNVLNDFSNGGQAIDPIANGDYVPVGNPVGLYVGAAGAVKIDTIESTGVVVQAIAGAVLPWAVRKVWQTGTTATGLVTIRLV
jgi:hypothetical protein